MAVRTVEKVTVPMLKAIKTGESVAFRLKTPRMIYAAASLAYKNARMMGCRFSTATDFENLTITITKTEQK